MQIRRHGGRNGLPRRVSLGMMIYGSLGVLTFDSRTCSLLASHRRNLHVILCSSTKEKSADNEPLAAPIDKLLRDKAASKGSSGS